MTPRCSGWSTASESIRYASIISATLPCSTLSARSCGTSPGVGDELRDDDQKIRFTRTARINVGGPQLELSYAPDAATAPADRVVTWTLTARNSGALTDPVPTSAARTTDDFKRPPNELDEMVGFISLLLGVE